MKSTILLAEDHAVLRDGLRSLIELIEDIEVVAQAVALARRHRPDVVVMDIWLPRLSGIDATREIAGRLVEAFARPEQGFTSPLSAISQRERVVLQPCLTALEVSRDWCMASSSGCDAALAIPTWGSGVQ